MTKLSPKQTRYVSIDAVNHVVEAATTTVANPLAILLAEETIRLVAKYLPKASGHWTIRRPVTASATPP
ncbi:MAG: iron-containing alcohol dehydrogenase [Bilophila sp.]